MLDRLLSIYNINTLTLKVNSISLILIKICFRCLASIYEFYNGIIFNIAFYILYFNGIICWWEANYLFNHHHLLMTAHMDENDKHAKMSCNLSNQWNQYSHLSIDAPKTSRLYQHTHLICTDIHV